MLRPIARIYAPLAEQLAARRAAGVVAPGVGGARERLMGAATLVLLVWGHARLPMVPPGSGTAGCLTGAAGGYTVGSYIRLCPHSD